MKIKENIVPSKERQDFSIDQILEMTVSSESRWSDSVIEEREERI